MNKRVEYLLNQLRADGKTLFMVGAIASLIVVPILSIVLKLKIELTSLSLLTAITYTILVILSYSWKAKKEVN